MATALQQKRADLIDDAGTLAERFYQPSPRRLGCRFRALSGKSNIGWSQLDAF